MEKTLGDQHSSVEMLKDDADRLEAAYKREIDEIKKQFADLRQQLPKPDPDWREICERCFKNGATEPPDCKYYTEDGCMSPIPDQHPLIQVGNAAKLREVAEFVAHIDDNGYTSHDVQCAIEKARAAIAAPARNCDVPLVVDGSADNNADKAWLVFRRHNPDAYFDVSGLLRCIDWLLAPSTEQEGGNNGNE